MHPAWSLLLFTTLAGTAQGLLLALAVASWLLPLPTGFLLGAIALAEVLLTAGLLASFFHLGQKGRAWRAAAMWRTSWMSREVIILPLLMAWVALWWLAIAMDASPTVLRVLSALVVVGTFALWYCTAMIYACLRFLQEWAHPLTVVNFTLLGMSSGIVLLGALSSLAGQNDLLQSLQFWALGSTLLAWFMRRQALRRNARLSPTSTLQSATGIQNPNLVQKSMGMSAGSFNTREFFHGATAQTVRRMPYVFQILLFALPLLLVAALGAHSAMAWILAVLLQFAGLLAERWVFFAQARHPQNLFYQTVS
jgi:DMSO reductase anchor subunit